MKNIHHIMVAIDFTPRCRVALREAARQAAINAATLTAVHIMNPALVHDLERSLGTDEGDIVSQWRGHLEKFVQTADAGEVRVGLDVCVGHPLTGLSDACQRHRADLLVMGVRGADTHGPRVGAVAAKCVRKVSADVLLVGENNPGPFKHIVACVDFSDNSARAVSAALRIARQDGATVDCVHVHQLASAASMYYGELGMAPFVVGPEMLAERAQELQDFVTPLQETAADTPVNFIILDRGSIREAMQEHVLTSHADLVVLGTRGKNGLREMMLGTTAEKLVAQAQCSVLAIKPEGFLPLWDD